MQQVDELKEVLLEFEETNDSTGTGTETPVTEDLADVSTGTEISVAEDLVQIEVEEPLDILGSSLGSLVEETACADDQDIPAQNFGSGIRIDDQGRPGRFSEAEAELQTELVEEYDADLVDEEEDEEQFFDPDEPAVQLQTELAEEYDALPTPNDTGDHDPTSDETLLGSGYRTSEPQGRVIRFSLRVRARTK